MTPARRDKDNRARRRPDAAALEGPPVAPADAVLYIDAHVIVINKPAGLASHAGPKTLASVEDWLESLRFGFHRRPQLAHRLDRDTSGCLLLGRHPKALRQLGQAFEARTIEKAYWAVVTGELPAPAGLIDQPLARHSTPGQGWRVVVDARGQAAQTRWRVLGATASGTLLELTPLTGRTHQLRVHLAALGCPIVGDAVYGSGVAGEPMLLHARTIGWRLPVTAPLHSVEAPLPEFWPELPEGL